MKLISCLCTFTVLAISHAAFAENTLQIDTSRVKAMASPSPLPIGARVVAGAAKDEFYIIGGKAISPVQTVTPRPVEHFAEVKEMSPIKVALQKNMLLKPAIKVASKKEPTQLLNVKVASKKITPNISATVAAKKAILKTHSQVASKKVMPNIHLQVASNKKITTKIVSPIASKKVLSKQSATVASKKIVSKLNVKVASKKAMTKLSPHIASKATVSKVMPYHTKNVQTALRGGMSPHIVGWRDHVKKQVMGQTVALLK